MDEILIEEQHDHGIDQGLKERLEAIVKHTDDFEDMALFHSEKHSMEMRVKMAKDIKKMTTFDEKSNFIDKKIEYD